MDSGITALPLMDFMADPTSGRVLVERLYGLLGADKRILVWGPRVGAIELAEDLLMLWPSAGEVVAVNPGALCTRTRQDGQDSEWVQWVDTTPQKLIEETLARKPKGVVVLFAGPAIVPVLPALLGGPWGFVTAIAASSAEEAQARFAALAGENASRVEVLIGLAEVGTATHITDVRFTSGGPPLAALLHGKYLLG